MLLSPGKVHAYGQHYFSIIENSYYTNIHIKTLCGLQECFLTSIKNKTENPKELQIPTNFITKEPSKITCKRCRGTKKYSLFLLYFSNL